MNMIKYVYSMLVVWEKLFVNAQQTLFFEKPIIMSDTSLRRVSDGENVCCVCFDSCSQNGEPVFLWCRTCSNKVSTLCFLFLCFCLIFFLFFLLFPFVILCFFMIDRLVSFLFQYILTILLSIVNVVHYCVFYLHLSPLHCTGFCRHFVTFRFFVSSLSFVASTSIDVAMRF